MITLSGNFDQPGDSHAFNPSFVSQSMDHFDDIGPSVVMASPGMIQNGLSRELFESWCTDKRNGVIIAGYCVEGTLAKVSCHLGVRVDIPSRMLAEGLLRLGAFGRGAILHRLYYLSFPGHFCSKILDFSDEGYTTMTWTFTELCDVPGLTVISILV